MTVPAEMEAFAATLGPDLDEVQRDMEARVEDEWFPTVGPAVGGWLYLLATTVDACRVFEFGSGFGYSAYWFARALPADGEVVLTEVDEDELDEARTFLARGGFDDRARFEHGDAIEIVDRYEGPFDVVLLDNEKHRYVEAFEAAREKVPVGGVVCADNVTAGPVGFETVAALVDGEDVDADESERGIVDYLHRVRGDPDFETALLPLGEGVAVSVRHDRE
jgi:predicted O-methyltransferase YrrM